MKKDKFGLTVKIKKDLKSFPTALLDSIRYLTQVARAIFNFVRMILAILNCSVDIVETLSTLLRILAGVALNYSKEQLISAAA